MKKWIFGVLLVIASAAGGFWVSADKDMKALISHLPTDANVLFWSVEQRDAAFRTMDRIPILAKANVIAKGDKVYPLPQGTPLTIDTDVDAYMKAQRTAGLVIIHDGKVRMEKYGLDFDAQGKWTSFSVAKSFTSTLVGAAIKDGYIKSIDDKVSAYIPDLKGSAYDDVTIAQLLTMTSGVKWNEDYEDPKSDVALFNAHKAENGMDVTVSYMRNLPREAPAGTKWVYKTGETNLIGVLVSSATKKTLSAYLSEKLWAPFGMEQDASWLLGATGHEISGCCIQASTRDYARFGMFMLGGAKVNGISILPDNWIAPATSKQADIAMPGKGYGYQWWTYDDGSYAAQGIFGQGIFIDPKRNLVIASNSNWPKATDPNTVGVQREAFYKAVQAAVDAEAKSRAK
ncbi:serine hydrolase domain-containing protein [Sphingorhabdus wooponensis]|jgi:CubicO group peptidase (beta-lactamase class C family)|uniref:Class A beta-lactamase-related serine hydrolase n=1 Tax=Sphingorhabdus wooponensis TaxID=940136 RepID=A0A426RSB4_9SPHN|nr:serine hydrolase domain-containing protein [Sphingorhabdus wooponensis]RRQ51854.1 class A beta-lactamase-related serine hydrolase [Sphingorhabdus wooponensis]